MFCVRGVASPLTSSVAAAPGLTTIPVSLPVRLEVTASVAVTEEVAAVLSVTPLVNVWMPASRRSR